MMATPALETDLCIEAGTSGDLDSVMTVMDSAFGDRFGEAWTRSQLAGILPMAGVALTLARDCRSNKVVGFSLVRAVADESELLLIAVGTDHQRRGIGRAFLEQFVGAARDRSISRIHLEVREGNPAVAMYRDAGFAPVGRRRNYYHARDGQRFDALTLARQL